MGDSPRAPPGSPASLLPGPRSVGLGRPAAEFQARCPGLPRTGSLRPPRACFPPCGVGLCGLPGPLPRPRELGGGGAGAQPWPGSSGASVRLSLGGRGLGSGDSPAPPRLPLTPELSGPVARGLVVCGAHTQLWTSQRAGTSDPSSLHGRFQPAASPEPGPSRGCRSQACWRAGQGRGCPGIQTSPQALRGPTFEPLPRGAVRAGGRGRR